MRYRRRLTWGFPLPFLTDAIRGRFRGVALIVAADAAGDIVVDDDARCCLSEI